MGSDSDAHGATSEHVAPANRAGGPAAKPTTHELAADRRFTYALYVPDAVSGASPPGLVVTVHGSERHPEAYLAGFVEFARSHGQVVLAPHFPADVDEGGGADGYKRLADGKLRYDLLLTAMIDQAAAATGCAGGRFLLHGYSGGAQFAHRFLMLHPRRVRAAVVGAPGEVTLLDEGAEWWAGVGDVRERFGVELDEAALRRVALELQVGENDTDTIAMREQPPSRFWSSDTERLAANRIGRLRALHRSLLAIGAAPRFQLMAGVNHGAGRQRSLALAQRFFSEQLGGATGA